MKRILVVAVCCITWFEANAQLADTIKKDILTAPDTVTHLHSKTLALVPPAALIAYGALSFKISPIRRVDYFVHGEIEKKDPNFNTKTESYLQFAPIVLVYGLNLAGVEGKNRFIDRTALMGLSEGILSVSSFITKHSTHRLRPNGNDYFSFPSGHTSTAFAGAEFMAQEYGGRSAWYGVLGYSFAVTTGVFRLYNRDHWFSDVVAGAGFGIISTKAAYLVYPYLRNWLTHTNRSGKSVMVMPLYQDGTTGLSLTMQL